MFLGENLNLNEMNIEPVKSSYLPKIASCLPSVKVSRDIMVRL